MFEMSHHDNRWQVCKESISGLKRNPPNDDEIISLKYSIQLLFQFPQPETRTQVNNIFQNESKNIG